MKYYCPVYKIGLQLWIDGLISLHSLDFFGTNPFCVYNRKKTKSIQLSLQF